MKGCCQFSVHTARMRRNLTKLYREASASDIAQGLAWYPTARGIVADWSAHYGYSIQTIACVVAALSPQCEWKRNLIAADDILARRPVSVAGPLPANVRKAHSRLMPRCAKLFPKVPR